ncbi:MAG: precorrin-6A/cobalt-precorrin-6A reductase [Lachnospiraceae bacterium]
MFARVLPDSQVLKKCEDLGLHGAHIIAMQGPFSVELNCALLRTVQAGWLVTKEAGKRGGFAEKIEAARQCGVSVVVIRRPVHEEGISLEEAKRQMDAYRTARPPENSVADGTGRRFLSMIGMGMGGAKQLTLEAWKCWSAVILCSVRPGCSQTWHRGFAKNIRKPITSRKRFWTGWKKISLSACRGGLLRGYRILQRKRQLDAGTESAFW